MSRCPNLANATRLARCRGRSRTTVIERKVSRYAAIGSHESPSFPGTHRFCIMPQQTFKPYGMAILGAKLGRTCVNSLKVGNLSVPLSSDPIDAVLFNCPHPALQLVDDEFIELESDDISLINTRALPLEFPTCEVGTIITIDIVGPCTSVVAWGRVLFPVYTRTFPRKNPL